MMKFLTILLVTLFLTLNVFAQLKLPSIISDNMVLQRDMNVPIWGWATPNQKVTVKFMNQIKTTIADSNGCWKIYLDSMNATSKPQKMIVKSNTDTLTIKNILIGEVWLCGGQSNMEFPMKMLKNSEKEIKKAKDKNIRLLIINKFDYKLYEADDCNAYWVECSPEIIKDRTAVGYYFACELRKKLGVPIGLIDDNFGGTAVASWTPANVYNKWPQAQKLLTELKKYNKKNYNLIKEKEKLKWFDVLKKFDNGFSNNWMNPKINLTGWKKINIPTMWNKVKDLKNFKGTVWLRKEINIPKNWEGKTLNLKLPPINEFDIVWFNGKNVGVKQKYFWIWNPQPYKIDKSKYKTGKNVISLCIYNKKTVGGINGSKNDIKIYPENMTDNSISLAGTWYYNIGYVGSDLPQAPLPFSVNHNTFSVLYNSMIAPIIPFGIRGVIWYQGESNQLNPGQYREMFADMIKSWRKNWRQGNFPFYYVQIAPYNYNNGVNSALLREAQLKALNIKNVGMAVTMDIGNPNDIHPKNKKDVGYRLALWALAKTYGFTNIVFSGPIYKNMKINKNKIILAFKYADGLKTRDGKPLTHFEIAGKDHKFVPATAEIKNNKVIVYSDKVKNPIAVRYAWSDTAEPNLCNSAGLPAPSFRTDNWEK